MATMTTGQRAACASALMNDFSQRRSVLAPLTKADLRAAVDAADQWVSDNAAAFNAALPVAARGALTAAQKSHLLTAAIQARFASGT